MRISDWSSDVCSSDLAAEFDQLIRTLSDTLGLTVVMVTHDLDSLYSISDRVAVVADQKIVEVSPIAELERSDHPWIRAFLGEIGRASCRDRECRTCSSRWSTYH